MILNDSIKAFASLIRGMIREEIKDIDQTVPCRILSTNQDGSVNISLISDPNTILYNIENASKYSFDSQDVAYLFKIKNNLSNSFIIGKNRR